MTPLERQVKLAGPKYNKLVCDVLTKLLLLHGGGIERFKKATKIEASTRSLIQQCTRRHMQRLSHQAIEAQGDTGDIVDVEDGATISLSQQAIDRYYAKEAPLESV